MGPLDGACGREGRSAPPISGCRPQTEGQVIRLRIPELNEERRKELVKVAHKYAEAARVAVRHVRRDGMEVLKKLEKDHTMSEDEHKRQSDRGAEGDRSGDPRHRRRARRQRKRNHDGVVHGRMIVSENRVAGSGSGAEGAFRDDARGAGANIAGTVPDVPRHVAIIMDGNGRWAAARGLPRVEGHRRGVEALRKTVRAAGEMGIRCLTIFSFSSENWQRPASEVRDLMG